MIYQLDLQKRTFPWHAVVCTLVLVLFSLIWTAQSVSADDAALTGRIEVMPAEGLIGMWEVDGFVFATTRVTEFRQEEGEFAIGQCVEVEYATVAEQTLATQLSSKSDDDCTDDEGTATETATPESTTAPVETPSPTATDDDDDDDERDTIKAHGFVNLLPAEGFRGLWTIGDEEYRVTSDTRIRQKDGPIRVGSCVEVRYVVDAEGNTAVRIESERSRNCGHDGTPTPGSTIPAPTVTPDPSATEDEGPEVRGILESFPDGLVGEWVIAGQVYIATESTEFEEDRGDFEAGVCVKGHLESADSSVLVEIETTNHFRCGDDDSGDDDGQVRGRLYGVIQEFPEDLIGDWQIGGLTLMADADTEFEQEDGEFAVGVTVKVQFALLADGTFYATEIETKFANDHDGHDDDDNDVYEGAEGHAYGLLESFPADLMGEWYVGGISYTVTSETHFVRPHSNFEEGVMVRVKYRTNADGIRIARHIKTTSEDGGASGEGHATLYGYVDQMPINGFVGEWVIDGVSFQADGTTNFKEEHGLLGLGSYVKMEYFTSNGRNVLHEVETEVPPGAGDDTDIGEIESIDSDDGASSRALGAANVNAAIWTIDGQAYVVTAATDLNEFQGELTVGSTVNVNSYTADDGSVVATQIRGVTLANTIFLPILAND